MDPEEGDSPSLLVVDVAPSSSSSIHAVTEIEATSEATLTLQISKALAIPVVLFSDRFFSTDIPSFLGRCLEGQLSEGDNNGLSFSVALRRLLGCPLEAVFGQ